MKSIATFDAKTRLANCSIGPSRANLPDHEARSPVGKLVPDATRDPRSPAVQRLKGFIGAFKGMVRDLMASRTGHRF